MSEGFVQLPTDGAGKQFRTEVGDGTNQIPSGEHEEVLIVSDAQGLLPGDRRQQPMNVRVLNTTLEAILQELQLIRGALT